MLDSLLTSLTDTLGTLRDALLTAGRLTALAHLREPRLRAQHDLAREVSLRVEQAGAVQDFLARYYNVREPQVAWPAALVEELTSWLESGAPVPAIEHLRKRTLAQASGLAEQAILLARSNLHGGPTLQLVEALHASLPNECLGGFVSGEAPEQPRRVLRGPSEVALDPVFAPAFSLADGPEPTRRDLDIDKCPECWCLAVRECMASELCALSIAEYDGLPLAFHRDFAKQCWDEARHALFFLDVALELLPSFVRDAPRGHPLLASAKQMLAEGRGLGVPAEGNLYSVVWSLELAERLVVMHLDSETPGAAQALADARGPFAQTNATYRSGMEVVARDEATHARLGQRWLKHLLPSDAEREETMTRARYLRAIHIVRVMAQQRGVPLMQMAQAFLSQTQEAPR
ncbi:MAG: hypothetical protein JST92_04625 [Deltaproteobacteria bacterium]|nr:hypothetical protein [Deltaproteobacteria bacterium]